MRDFDTNNCFLVIIFFFLASTVYSSLSGFLITWLGFPFAWVGFISFLLLGAWFYLIYKHYSPLSWLLLFCVGFFLVAVVALYRGVFMTEPAIPEDVQAFLDTEEADLNFYGTYYDDSVYDDPGIISSDRDKFILSSYWLTEARTPITIQFPSIQTPGGQWVFNSGEVRVSGAMSGVFKADPTLNWIQADEAVFDAEQPDKIANPYLVVSLPINRVHSDQQMTLDATLDMTYPGRETAETLNRSVDILVASEHFYTYSYEYNTWRQARRVVETPIWLVLVVGSVAAVGGAGALARMGALRVQSGSLMIEVRRISGIKRLGVEAHSLAKLETDAQEGVLLGFVNAQSPAGRAGLRSGDNLITLGGKPVKSPRDVNRIASRYKKGEVAQAGVLRNGEYIDLSIKF